MLFSVLRLSESTRNHIETNRLLDAIGLGVDGAGMRGIGRGATCQAG